MPLSKANTIAKGIGLYQIIGAIEGLALCGYSFNNYQVSLFWWFYLLIATLFQLLFLVAGVKLFQLKSAGFTLTFYSQLIQLVSFYLLGFGYKNASGIGLFIGLDFTNTIELAWRIAFTSIVGLGKAGSELQVVYINFIPLVLLWLLERAKLTREATTNRIFAK